MHKEEKILNVFNPLNHDGWYIGDREYQAWKKEYADLVQKIDPATLHKIKGEDALREQALRFYNLWHNGRELINEYNEEFIKKESPKIKNLLNKKEIQNNDDQVKAIASDEDNTLLVAGAGTGKTTTILGKLAYLIDRERFGVKPEEILILSFTGKAVEELQDRIDQKFPDSSMEVRTFHSFGLSILGKVLGKKPELAFKSEAQKKKFIDEVFEKLCSDDSSYFKKVIKYFAYYLRPVVLEPGFKTLDDYYKYVDTERFLTLQKEEVKSQQEVMIANFLFMHSINYVYEKSYEHDVADPTHGQYKPDFYLPDYGVYIEHFGINRKGEVRFSDNAAQNARKTKEYQEEMEWKRETHKKYGTNLIETFSYEFTERTWAKSLAEKLKEHDVKPKQRNAEEIFSALKEENDISRITQLMSTFLDLAKSDGYTVEDLKNKFKARSYARELAFLDIFAPIYSAYNDYLKETGRIDFHDMLLNAAKFAEEGKYKHNFKYVLIDEFQDFSRSKYVLVRALCEQGPDTKLFCVGDDWQSIFRFAGSDVSFMTNFEQEHGFTRENKLVSTNRFNNKLAIVSNKFILKNPNQIRKELKAEKDISVKAVEVLNKEKAKGSKDVLDKILKPLDNVAHKNKRTFSVFLLGRYRHNKPENLSAYKRRYKNLSIEFLTVHSSKGSEADYVIILDAVSGKYGFPSEIADDPILDLVLSRSDPYPHAEERRLMYVALTRARHKVFIITEKKRQSVFVLELQGIERVDEEFVECEYCGGEMVRRSGPYGVFYGCSNYPQCRHKRKV